MELAAVSIYRPAWLDPSGRRIAGLDEDSVTMAVAALQPLVGIGAAIERVVIVTRAPAVLEGDSGAIIARALGLDGIPVREVLGGAPEVVDELLDTRSGTAVVAVQPGEGAGAGAMLLGSAGAVVRHGGSRTSGLPMRTRRPGDLATRTYDDPRLIRELAWKPDLVALVGPPPTIVVGVPAALQRTGGYDAEMSGEVDLGGPAAVPAALALLSKRGGGRVVAVEQAEARALDLSGTVELHRTERPAVPRPSVTLDGDPDIPISLAAYARAFESKVGLLAGCCEHCGALSLPARYRCIECGSEGSHTLTALPRSGVIYSVITVRVPVPGLASPYSLAIVELDGVDVRLLVQVTDVPAGTAAIGDRGELVLRKVADRQGVPDYGYAFQPANLANLEVAS